MEYQGNKLHCIISMPHTPGCWNCMVGATIKLHKHAGNDRKLDILSNFKTFICPNDYFSKNRQHMEER